MEIYSLGQKSNEIYKLNIKLYSLGFLQRQYVNDYYSKATEDAVKRYQKYSGFDSTGNVDNITLESLKVVPQITDNADIDNNVTNNKTFGNNNTNTFWNNDNDTVLRKNNNDITIKYGEGSKSKILKNVIFKSKQQVITVDNNVEDVYEFIARDLIESED